MRVAAVSPDAARSEVPASDAGAEGAPSHELRFDPDALRAPSTRAASASADRVVYERAKHGDVARFHVSRSGRLLRRQFAEGATAVGRFLDAHAVDASADAVLRRNGALRRFEERVGRGPALDGFATHYRLLAGGGKRDFDRILAGLEPAPRREVVEAVERLPEALDVCAPGVVTNLRALADEVDAALGGTVDRLRRAYRETAEQTILEHVRRRHREAPRFAGNEIHYVNGYRARVDAAFGLDRAKDPYDPGASGGLTPESVRACETALRAALSPYAFLTNLAERAVETLRDAYGGRARLDGDDLVRERLAPVEATLRERFGPLRVGDAIEETEAFGVYAAREDLTGLEHALAENLREVGLLAPGASRSIGEDAASGVAVRRLGPTVFVETRDGAERGLRRLAAADFDAPPLTTASDPALIAPAIRLRRPDAARGLIARAAAAGADLRVRDERGAEPILYAAAAGYAGVVEALARAGADVEARDADDASAMLYAAWNGHVGAIAALRAANASIAPTRYDGFSPLMAAAANDRATAVRALTRAGADVEARDADDASAMLHAARGGCVGAIGALSAASASPAPRRADGFSPLMAAAAYAHAPAVRELLSAGAPIDAVGPRGRSALTFAAGRGAGEAVAALLEARAGLESRDDLGRTALMHAAMGGHADAARRLVDAGAQPEARDDERRTPLMYAASAGDAATALALIARGARRDRRDIVGCRAVDYCADGAALRRLLAAPAPEARFAALLRRLGAGRPRPV